MIFRNLSPELAIPLAYKNIFFNCEFLTGLFIYCSQEKFFEIIQYYVLTVSRYYLGENVLGSLMKINLFYFTTLSCGIDLFKYPESALNQIVSRFLIFLLRIKIF